MTWRTHLAGGLATLWFLPPLHAVETAPVLALAAGLGALLPDLDARESHLKHLTLGTGIAPFALPAVVLHRWLGHRGLLHSALGLTLCGIVFGIPLLIFRGTEMIPALLALLLGYVSHLALDAATRAGIPLWYPNRKRVHLLPPTLRITTGSTPEDIVLAVLSLLAFARLLPPLLR